VPHRNAEANLKALRDLCAQAEKLRQYADELCGRLTAQMEATRASVHLDDKPKTPEPRRKPRKGR
jgi:hypothetical protein